MKFFSIIWFCLFFGLRIFGAAVISQNKPQQGDWDFKLEKVWQIDQAGENVLVRGNSIQVDEEGNIFFLELKHAKVFVFDKFGEFLNSFGKKGEGPGEYKMVQRMLLKGDKIIIPDMGRFHFFSKNGNFQKTVVVGSMVFPRTFIDENRFVFVQEMEEDSKKLDNLKIHDFLTKKSVKISSIESEKALTASSGGMVVMVKDSSTTPGVIVAARNNYLYFGKNDKYHIKKTDLMGNEKLSFKLQGRERKNISMAFKRKRFDSVLLNGQKMPKKMVDQMIKGIPDKAPFYNRIMVDNAGLIYVFVADLENETGREIDIFSPQGKYLYHGEIKMPDELVIKSGLTFKAGYLYVFTENGDGDGQLLKFKVDMPTI